MELVNNSFLTRLLCSRGTVGVNIKVKRRRRLIAEQMHEQIELPQEVLAQLQKGLAPIDFFILARVLFARFNLRLNSQELKVLAHSQIQPAPEESNLGGPGLTLCPDVSA